MADKIKLVQGDTRPALVVTLTDEVTGLPINITGATPRLKFRKAAAATLTATLDGTVTDGVNGQVAFFWTQDELLAWGSEGQIELVKLKPDAATKTVEHQLVAGAKQTAPIDSVQIIEIRQNKNGGAVTVFDRATMDRFLPNWMVTPTASSVTQWCDDPQPDTFYVLPAQSATPATVILTHVFAPPALTANGTLGVRDIYQSQIENYILFRAFSKDSEPASAERAVAYGKAFYG